ncbi:hypothetical protein [Rivularia sp. UHCC 0363]|uniref:hypothetical protein n=1 Tax=Rivularia sp. UHCC 0363 TaxID=3110244 RepID=UPI002B209151|nr:hypothetical protein [Rivularia sp. UHCC 0363]MEA5595183.1 hypothetical protein [Rivularia sp. UHCC 0363]
MKSDISPESIKNFGIDSPKKAEVHAPPLVEFNERDWKILAELFDRKDSDEIEEDINKALSWMVPEPAWEDEPLDFLQDYL